MRSATLSAIIHRVNSVNSSICYLNTLTLYTYVDDTFDVASVSVSVATRDGYFTARRITIFFFFLLFF